MVSIHWATSPDLSHTATFTYGGGRVTGSVVTYDGPDADPCRKVSGELADIVKMLVRPRYGLRPEHMCLARYQLHHMPIHDRVLQELEAQCKATV